MDTDGIGKALQDRVLAYMQSRPPKSQAEIQANVDWCVKMLNRTKRCDAEGMFRWHWLLADSLEIYFAIIKQPYWGPKKALKWMEHNCPDAFSYYEKALGELSAESLENWIVYMKRLSGKE